MYVEQIQSNKMKYEWVYIVFFFFILHEGELRELINFYSIHSPKS